MIFLRQSTASQEVLLGPFLDDTDGKTAETGLTIANTDIKVWKRGGTTEASKTSGGATHIASGRYYAVLDATDTDTVGELFLNVAVSGALPVRLECCVLEEAVFDDLFAVSAGGYLKPTTAGRTLDVSATGAAGIDWANIENVTSSVAFTGTTIATTQKVDVETIKTQTVTCAAGVTVLASVGTAATSTAQTGDCYAIVNSGTHGNSALKTLIDDVPTVAEFNARTLVAADYFDPATDTVANVTTVGSVTGAVGSVTNSAAKYALGAVWIGPTANTNTVSYVDGIVTNPVSTIAAAQTIADALKLRRFFTVRTGSSQIGADMTGYTFEGDQWSVTTTGGSRDVGNSTFKGADVDSGTFAGTGGSIRWETCKFATGVSVGISNMQNCRFEGTLTLSEAGQYNFNDCLSNVAGIGTPVFAVPAGTVGLAFRRWSGGISITGITSGTTISIDVVSGGTVLLAGADGVVHVRGMVAAITDSRTGTPTLVRTAVLNQTEIATPTNITAASGVTLTATTGLGNQTANITGTVSGNSTHDAAAVLTALGNGSWATEAGGTGDHLTAVPWNATWDAEVQSEVQDAIEVNHLDHLLAVDYDPASKPGVATALLNELIGDDVGVSQFTANALELAPTGGSAPTVGQIADEVQTRTIAAVTVVNGLATDVITAASIATDAITEIQANLATSTALATAQADLDIITGADGVNLLSATQTQITTIAADVVNIDGAAMRGTDNAALAATALSTATWTNTLATNIGTTNTTVATNLDATISSRMATYTQPTGFLAATFPSDVAGLTALSSAHGAGSWATATGFSTHAAADVVTAMGTGTFLTAVPWNATWDAEVQSEVQDAIEANHLDHLLAADYDPGSKPGVATALLNELIGDDLGVSQFTANALELAPTGGSAPTVGQIADEVQTRTIAAVTTVNGLAANTITAAALAADAVTEMQSGLSTLTQTQVTGGAYAINSASFAFNAGLDFTTAQKAATLARVTLVDTTTTNTDMRGTDNAALAATALSTAVWTNTLATNIGTTNTTVATNLDATISSRMATYTQPTGFLAATFPTDVAGLTALASAHGAGSWATATGFSTHSAADVYTAFGTGSNLTALATATGFSTHSAADVIALLGSGTEVFGHSYLESIKRIEVTSGSVLSGAGTGTEVQTSSDASKTVTWTVDGSGNIGGMVWT